MNENDKWIIKTETGYYYTVGSRNRRYGRFTASRSGAEALTLEKATQLVDTLKEHLPDALITIERVIYD